MGDSLPPQLQTLFQILKKTDAMSRLHSLPLREIFQGFYNTRMPNSLALFWTRVFSRPVQFGQTTLNSDVIMLYDILQILELKSPKRQLQLKTLHQYIKQQF